MSDLPARMRQAVPEYLPQTATAQECMGAILQFVESVTFADPDELLAALRQVIGEYWPGLPPYARNLAYRMVCLQRPDDAALLREAADDLLASALTGTRRPRNCSAGPTCSTRGPDRTAAARTPDMTTAGAPLAGCTGRRRVSFYVYGLSRRRDP
ncbi:hypothetical protein [Streptomyces sp. NRRL S-237]|uniref:hypothetical protein n=1 Tax=Streptomyces sp. NRRL S-237 TaxID=1463895 RepID=UPI00068E486E|nr:hypothetical protein [Streptomyces sp. NRRL S-237]